MPPTVVAPGVGFLRTTAGVDLWRVELDAGDPAGAALLDREERERAARFVFERDRRRFVAGRAAVRAILAAYVGRPPGALTFTQGRWGKPALPGGPRFNTSGAQGWGLCGVGEGDRELGVDVEQLRPVPDAASVAASSFTPEERAAWLALGGGDREAFLRIWTRKEAALKALGVGLSGMEAAPGSAIRAALSRVEVVEVDFDAEHVAALAVAAP